MRTFLLVLVVLESTAIAAFGGMLLFGLDERFAVEPPAVPAFRPPIYKAAIGDHVRYQKRDKDDRPVGYLDCTVLVAREVRNTSLGRMFDIELVERGPDSKVVQKRTLHIQPRGADHGFLLPSILELERAQVPGARPVVHSIRTAPVPMPNGRKVPGFLVQAVIPRDGLDVVAERYWITSRVPVFGVARFERGGFTYVLHGSEKPR